MKAICLVMITLILTVGHSAVFSQSKSKKELAPTAVTIQGSAQATLTNTLSFTVPAGISRLLLVVASDDDALAVTNVAFNGVNMTPHASRNDGFAVDTVWSLPLGLGGSVTANIVVTHDNSTGSTGASFIAATLFDGVDQANPVNGIQEDNMTASNSMLTVPSDNGDVVFDIFDSFDGVQTPPEMQTPGAGQTQLHNVDDLPVGGPGFAYYQTSWRTGAAPNVPMSWTSTNSALIHIAVNINSLTPTAAAVSIGGMVLTAEGSGLPNALITMSDPDGNVRIARSNHFGNYMFTEVESGETYVLTAVSKGIAFTNPTRVISVTDELSNIDFVEMK